MRAGEGRIHDDHPGLYEAVDGIAWVTFNRPEAHAVPAPYGRAPALPIDTDAAFSRA